MKNYTVQVRIDGLAGTEQREITVKAKTELSAQRKAEAKLGNREYCVEGVYEIVPRETKPDLRPGAYALDGRSKLFDGLYRVVKGDWTVAYFESESDAVAYVAAGNRGEL